MYLRSQDEAYELGRQWAYLYDQDSPSRKFILDLMDKSLLVNIVHNDYKRPDAIFDVFYKAGAEYQAQKALKEQSSPVPNGSAH